MIGRTLATSAAGLRRSLKRTKIEYQNGGAYNKRWQWKWPHPYVTLDPLHPHTKVGTPESAPDGTPMFSAWWNDVSLRIFPALRMAFNRRERVYDKVNLYVFPSLIYTGYLLADLSTGFMLFQWLMIGTLYTRIRDKVEDPNLKEA